MQKVTQKLRCNTVAFIGCAGCDTVDFDSFTHHESSYLLSIYDAIQQVTNKDALIDPD